MMPFYIKSKKTDQAKYQQEVEKYKKINEDIEVMNSVNEQHAADDLVKQIINSQVDSSALDRFGGTGDGAYKLTQIYEKDIPESIKSTITKDYFIVYKWWHDYIQEQVKAYRDNQIRQAEQAKQDQIDEVMNKRKLEDKAREESDQQYSLSRLVDQLWSQTAQFLNHYYQNGDEGLFMNLNQFEKYLYDIKSNSASFDGNMRDKVSDCLHKLMPIYDKLKDDERYKSSIDIQKKLFADIVGEI